MKRFLVLLICLILISGCSSSDEVSQDQMNTYNDLVTSVNNNGGHNSYMIPFNYELSVKKISSGYSYTLVINKPQIVMNNIQFIAINSEASKSDMAACIGVFDDEDISLIPNQSAPDKGYPAGIALNGVSKVADFNIYCLAIWYNDDNTEQTKAFFNFHVASGKVSGE